LKKTIVMIESITGLNVAISKNGANEINAQKNHAFLVQSVWWRYASMKKKTASMNINAEDNTVAR
jgi:hypothetical protein